MLLVQWAGEASWPLAIEPVDLRIRYCAWGMDQARQADTILAGEPELDRYLLQLWPAPPAPDQVLKQTGATAAYWHQWAQGLPPPPSAEEKARMAEQADREEQARRWQGDVDLMWGGVPPTERLQTVGGNSFGLAKMDRRLLDAIAEATADVQRDIARWAARRACDHAGLSALDWVCDGHAEWGGIDRRYGAATDAQGQVGLSGQSRFGWSSGFIHNWHWGT